MTATATAEIRRRLRDAEGLLTSAAGQLAGWEDPAASRIRPDVDEVAPNLGVISRHAADLDERVDAAIAHTRAFFEAMGIPTRLGAYNLGAEAIDAVLKQLEAHGMTRLGEQREVTLEVSRRVLEGAL